MKTAQKVPSTKINYPSKTKETKPGQLLVLCWVNSGTYGTSSRTYGSPAGTIPWITHFWKNRVPHFWKNRVLHFWKYGLIHDWIDWSSSGAYRFLQVAERNVTFWTEIIHNTKWHISEKYDSCILCLKEHGNDLFVFLYLRTK